MGRKKRPFYRIVVADVRAPRDGRYIEAVGTYDPLKSPPDVRVDEERMNYWLDQGAIPTDTVRSLLRRLGLIYRRNMKKRGYDEARIEEEMKKWEVLQIERRRREETKDEALKKAKMEAKAAEAEAKEAPAEEENQPVPETETETEIEIEKEIEIEIEIEIEKEPAKETVEEKVESEVKQTEQETTPAGESTEKEDKEDQPSTEEKA